MSPLATDCCRAAAKRSKIDRRQSSSSPTCGRCEASPLQHRRINSQHSVSQSCGRSGLSPSEIKHGKYTDLDSNYSTAIHSATKLFSSSYNNYQPAGDFSYSNSSFLPNTARHSHNYTCKFPLNGGFGTVKQLSKLLIHLRKQILLHNNLFVNVDFSVTRFMAQIFKHIVTAIPC
jgi:hypothetical protein